MSYTISLHNDSKWSRQHNIRGANLAQKEAHIDPDGYHTAIVDKTIEESYLETFGDAVTAYNARQKRSDRRIVNYLAKVREEHKRSPTKKPKASYEMIVTVGNRDEAPSVEESERVCRDWLERFQKQNPNVVVFGAYFHADEPGSAAHMHVDYYFVKRENKRGLSVQVSQNGALQEQGYIPKRENGKFVTPQTQFQRNSRELLRSVAKEHGLDVEDRTVAERYQEHLDTDRFKEATRLRELENQIEKANLEVLNVRKMAEEEKRETSRLRVKRQEIEREVGDFQAVLKENRLLKSENVKLTKRVSVLERAVDTLQSAFDFVEDMLKRLNMEYKGREQSLWKVFKDRLFDKRGKREYDEFQSIRHDFGLNKNKLNVASKRYNNDWER